MLVRKQEKNRKNRDFTRKEKGSLGTDVFSGKKKSMLVNEMIYIEGLGEKG